MEIGEESRCGGGGGERMGDWGGWVWWQQRKAISNHLSALFIYLFIFSNHSYQAGMRHLHKTQRRDVGLSGGPEVDLPICRRANGVEVGDLFPRRPNSPRDLR